MADQHNLSNLEDYPSIVQAPSITKGTNIELDFNRIKGQLRQYLEGQDQFTDYNFEASGLSFLLDILSYNTQMNAMTAHLLLNELFLESAQARPNVAIIAKQLGYTPSSVQGAVASVNITIKPRRIQNQNLTESLILEKNTRLTGSGYDWYVQERQTAQISDETQWFSFNNVPIKQGTRKSVQFIYDARIEYPTFELPDSDVDISTIDVTVKDAQNADFDIKYERFNKFNDLYEHSALYFLQENASGRYEIYFPRPADLGRNLSSGNIITVTYLYSNGSEANGISSFRIPSSRSILANSDITITTVNRAAGGSPKESIESIRHNAPKFYTTQNRCVTAQDYQAIIRNEAAYVEAITTWGGENENPPQYGKVFVCVKPRNGMILTQQQKDFIIDDIIRPRNVATIRPVIVDPDVTYLRPDIVAKCDPHSTPNTKTGIVNIIKLNVNNYNDQYLNQFNGVFRYSKFNNIIDRSELSIQSSSLKLYMFKKIVVTRRDQGFSFSFPTSLYKYFEDGTKYIMTSPIYWSSKRYHLVDYQDPSNENRRILKIIHKEPGSVETIINNDAGYIDLETSRFYVKGLNVTSGTEIRIFCRPGTFDISSSKEHIIQIEPNEVNVAVEWDPIANQGVAGSSDQFNRPNSTNYNYL